MTVIPRAPGLYREGVVLRIAAAPGLPLTVALHLMDAISKSYPGAQALPSEPGVPLVIQIPADDLTRALDADTEGDTQ